jgi:hypothetical protein
MRLDHTKVEVTPEHRRTPDQAAGIGTLNRTSRKFPWGAGKARFGIGWDSLEDERGK